MDVPKPNNPTTQIVSARYKGDDMLDFKKGETYQLEVTEKGQKVEVKKATGGTPAIYPSQNDYLKAWGNITPIQQNQQLPSCTIKIAKRPDGAIEVKSDGTLKMEDIIFGMELLKQKILSPLVK